MKRSIALLCVLVATPLHAAPPAEFFRALHSVETSGRHGPIKGDGGRALGPLQIHRAYHQDSRVPGSYHQVADYDYAVRVASAYLRRYAPDAWAKGDVATLAAIHNGGPKGAQKQAARKYAQKVQAAMMVGQRLTHPTQ